MGTTATPDDRTDRQTTTASMWIRRAIAAPVALAALCCGALSFGLLWLAEQIAGGKL